MVGLRLFVGDADEPGRRGRYDFIGLVKIECWVGLTRPKYVQEKLDVLSVNPLVGLPLFGHSAAKQSQEGKGDRCGYCWK